MIDDVCRLCNSMRADGKHDSMVRKEPDYDELCHCYCKIYILEEDQQYETVCTCNKTSSCPSFKCRPKWYDQPDHHGDEDPDGKSKEALHRVERYSGRDPARKKNHTAETMLMRNLSTQSVLRDIHLPEGSQECTCGCALSVKLVRASCECNGEENTVCDSWWFCNFTTLPRIHSDNLQPIREGMHCHDGLCIRVVFLWKAVVNVPCRIFYNTL